MTASTAWSFWSEQAPEVLRRLETGAQGLTGEDARIRLAGHALDRLSPRRDSPALRLLLAQFSSPIVLLLLLAAVLSFFLADRTDTAIILTIVGISGLLGFWQEYGATRAVERLLRAVRVTADVLRDGCPTQVPIDEVVPGDVVLLKAGDTIPGDCLILESKDLFVDEAALTGETYPIEKLPGVLAAETPLGRRTNSVFLGTHVVSGTGSAVVVRIGAATEFGNISKRLRLRPPETEFERGVRRFGYLLLEITLVLVIAIFTSNMFLNRPVLESFLFSLALAVGLTPQLLPAVISINLAHGARRMARRNVIVKRLASIENFGSMTVFCTDKTGTLTEGVVRLEGAFDLSGAPSERVRLYGYLNAMFETGFINPIDGAIRRCCSFELSKYRKLDEEPYDFVRKRLSVLVAEPGAHVMITKGAVPSVLDVCDRAEAADGSVLPIASVRETIARRIEEFGKQGFRTIAVAYRDMGAASRISRADETGMTFLGCLVFADPPRPGIADTLERLKRLGIALKIITGDHRLVAAYVGREVGLGDPVLLTGGDLRRIRDEALPALVNQVHVFAEVEPDQKERIILALKKAGHVVGYLGDGINDAAALHAADVGISVERAVDVAKEAADIVLSQQNLDILVEGVREGRTTFANTLKYVFMATSANFGNMFSMAGASVFLPFLPLLPKQILLTNLLTDIPEMAIATDRVDPELIDRPRRWNVRFIRTFMLAFGLVSSVFDFLTFAVLLWLLNADIEQFRTGWFVESVISASAIVLVIRSRRPFVKSRPGWGLTLATLAVAAATLGLPYTPLAGPLGFAPLPASFLPALAAIVGLYMLAAEMTKRAFYRRVAL